MPISYSPIIAAQQLQVCSYNHRNMNEHSIEQKLGRIEELLSKQTVLTKEYLNLAEAALYLGVSKSYLYKLTSTLSIPFCRPANKLIYFKRTELDSWVSTNSFGKKTLTNKIR